MVTMNLFGHLNRLAGASCVGYLPMTGIGPVGQAHNVGMLPVNMDAEVVEA